LGRKEQDGIELRTSLRHSHDDSKVGIVCKTDGLCESAFDGGPQNPGGVATYGFFICNEEGRPIAKDSGVVGEGEGIDHMVAEYEAVLHALRYLLQNEMARESVAVQNDNQQLVLEVKGEREFESGLHESRYYEAKRLTSMFPSICYQQVDREVIWEADCLTWKEYRRYFSDRNRLI
jgi:ribonuclease HI